MCFSVHVKRVFKYCTIFPRTCGLWLRVKCCWLRLQCWFACQRAACFAATVLACEIWPIRASLQPLGVYIYAFGSQSCVTRLIFAGSAPLAHHANQSRAVPLRSLLPPTALDPTCRCGAFLFVAFALAAILSPRLTACGNSATNSLCKPSPTRKRAFYKGFAGAVPRSYKLRRREITVRTKSTTKKLGDN